MIDLFLLPVMLIILAVLLSLTLNKYRSLLDIRKDDIEIYNECKLVRGQMEDPYIDRYEKNNVNQSTLIGYVWVELTILLLVTFTVFGLTPWIFYNIYSTTNEDGILIANIGLYRITDGIWDFFQLIGLYISYSYDLKQNWIIYFAVTGYLATLVIQVCSFEVDSTLNKIIHVGSLIIGSFLSSYSIYSMYLRVIEKATKSTTLLMGYFTASSVTYGYLSGLMSHSFLLTSEFSLT